jgi:hypothetical protein
MTSMRRLAGVGTVLAGLATLFAVGFSGTAAATPAENAPVASADQVMGASDCRDYLEQWGYDVGWRRSLACIGAATVGTPNAVAACTATLYATGVSLFHSGVACALAVAPSPAPSAGPF